MSLTTNQKEAIVRAFSRGVGPLVIAADLALSPSIVLSHLEAVGCDTHRGPRRGTPSRIDRQTKQSIYRAFKNGAKATKLAEQYGYTRVSIYRFVHEMGHAPLPRGKASPFTEGERAAILAYSDAGETCQQIARWFNVSKHQVYYVLEQMRGKGKGSKSRPRVRKTHAA